MKWCKKVGEKSGEYWNYLSINHLHKELVTKVKSNINSFEVPYESFQASKPFFKKMSSCFGKLHTNPFGKIGGMLKIWRINGCGYHLF
jgi:hypothetical protein